MAQITLSDPVIARLNQDVEEAVPDAKWQRLVVTFGGANTDFDIRHTLRVTDPENVEYQVRGADRATSIYHDQSSTRRPWGVGYIVLRSSAASAVVDLVLTVPRPR